MNWPYEFDFEHLDAENEHWKWCTCLDKEVYFRHKHVSPVIKKNTFLTKVYFLVIGFELKEKSKKSSERLSSGASDDKSQLVGGSSPPIWKICSSNWIISPRFGVNIKNLWNHQPVTTKKGQFPLFFPSKSQHPNLRVPRSQKKKKHSLTKLETQDASAWRTSRLEGRFQIHVSFPQRISTWVWNPKVSKNQLPWYISWWNDEMGLWSSFKSKKNRERAETKQNKFNFKVISPTISCSGMLRPTSESQRQRRCDDVFYKSCKKTRDSDLGKKCKKKNMGKTRKVLETI